MKKYFAEFIGTFALVFCGTGAIVIDNFSHGAIGHAGIAITFGLIVTAMIYAVGDVSGAHMNPAVTFGFFVAQKFPAKEIVPYVIAQTAGAFAASVTLHLLFPVDTTLGATMPAGSEMQSWILEFILTFILMFVIMRVAHGSKENGIMAGLAIGSVVLLEAMFAGPVCGASMNPVRSLAPALVSMHTEHLWIYLTAPVAGALVPSLMWRLKTI